MAAGITGFLIVASISTFCWLNVLSPRIRRRLNFRPRWPMGWFWGWVWPLKKQDRADLDAMSLASSLIGALLFSMITVVWLVVGLYRCFAG
jgi:hypothetical protein